MIDCRLSHCLRAISRTKPKQRFRLPAIASDVDGVLYRGDITLGNSGKVIGRLKQQRQPGSEIPVPFVLLTNGGGLLESTRADFVNKKIGVPQEGWLEGEDVIVCSTPFRELTPRFGDEYVVVTGLGDILAIAHEYGFYKALTTAELASLVPEISFSSRTKRSDFEQESLRRAVQDRLGISREDVLSGRVRFKAGMMWSDSVVQEEIMQIFSDLAISRDGHLGTRKLPSERQSVSLYISNPDILYADDYAVPRYAQGPILKQLQAVHRAVYDEEIECAVYGKPTKLTFDYAEKVLQRKAEERNVEISNFYMIGDYPQADV